MVNVPEVTVTATPPIVTVTPVRFVPVRVTDPPPETEPLFGLMPVRVGTPKKVYAPGEVADPSALTTVTSNTPAPCAGVVTVTVVAVALTTAAAVPPIVTVAPLRFEPVIVTVCPPAAGPLAGSTLVIVGKTTYV
jgi:hypothetical protein